MNTRPTHPNPLVAALISRATSRAKAIKGQPSPRRVKVPLADLVSELGRSLTSIRRELPGLIAVGLLSRWDDPDGSPFVTLGVDGARLAGVVLNPSSTRWMPAGKAARREQRQKGQVGRTPDGDPEEGVPAGVLAEERRLGYSRHVVPVLGIRPWPLEGQSTYPAGPTCLESAGRTAGRPPPLPRLWGSGSPGDDVPCPGPARQAAAPDRRCAGRWGRAVRGLSQALPGCKGGGRPADDRVRATAGPLAARTRPPTNQKGPTTP